METKHLLTNSDSSTDTKKNPASKAKFAKRHLFPLLQKYKNFDIGLWEVGAKRQLRRVNKKKSEKNFFPCDDFTPFMSKSFQI